MTRDLIQAAVDLGDQGRDQIGHVAIERPIDPLERVRGSAIASTPA
jgi:hypothetical protein